MRADAPDLTFLYPGDLATPTGGYIYDRALIAALERAGLRVETRSLGPGYPAPNADVRAKARTTLAALPDGRLTVIDGLACGVMAEELSPHADRLRLVALLHHPLGHESGLEEAAARALIAAERAALAHVRHVVTTSAATARSVRDTLGVAAEAVSVVEPGVEIVASAPAKRPRDGAGPLRLLSVGSLIPRKDHATLLDAVSRLARRDIRLDIAGSADLDPDHAAEIRVLIARLGLEEKVTLHGALPREALDALYRAADLFVLTTLYEGYGMAFVEAMAHGLPVIATGDGAVRDTVPETAGIVLPVGDVAAVADALARFADTPGERLALSRGARAHVARLPGWDTQAARFLTILKGIEQ
ncbi:glycosyltransferase family 4 protein [Stappia sp. ES.058]|uniref:glycosyltransferase family 4 protein n=1 Tax=Stappia sp. ES.058 TaxID=1881061 RepID=UPI00087CD59C|nr:glycosyltransferase family 4 protein [Stappia sp. ES.058]SDU48947.1 Glycosyltransferase involved in cell wall bisynthesis [Stappia sp. ES.058]